MPEPIITFDKVNKWFAQFHVLRDIDLEVGQGERIVICGPSGSGKSTLIRCINRLEEHQQGRLVVDGVELSDDIKAIFCEHLDLLGIGWTRPNASDIAIDRRPEVAKLDAFVGPKR